MTRRRSPCERSPVPIARATALQNSPRPRRFLITRSCPRCSALTAGPRFAAGVALLVCGSRQLRRYKLATLPPRTFCFWVSPIVPIQVSMNSRERGQGESVWLTAKRHKFTVEG